MTVIGITGGTGAGKTTALGVLKGFGACIIDCDELYHRLLETDRDMIAEIDVRFPGAVADGKLDRKRLGAAVFGNAEALSDLNVITHRYVYKAVCRILETEREKGTKIAAIDAIALMESGLGKLCDFTVGVSAPEERRIKRIMARENISEEYAKLRVSAQKPESFFKENCGYLLVNDFDRASDFEAYCHSFFKNKLAEEEAL